MSRIILIITIFQLTPLAEITFAIWYSKVKVYLYRSRYNATKPETFYTIDMKVRQISPQDI